MLKEAGKGVLPAALICALVVVLAPNVSYDFAAGAKLRQKTSSPPNAVAPKNDNARQGAATGQEEEDQELDGWERPITKLPKNSKPGPAPKHELSGIWDPGMKGVGMYGAINMPEDGNPAHQPPYTPAGRAALNLTIPNNGPRALSRKTNDPVFVNGDPQGMPREDLYELRTIQIYQSPQNVAILYMFNKVWRVIWTDGRELPKDPEPRWYGYSVGKWTDDNTFVVQTIGVKEETWIDRAGRPHGADMRVEERFHRPDRDHLELTVTIDDPKMYTKPWVGLDKFAFELQPSTFDVREMIWSPSEYERYNKLMGNPANENH